MKTEYLTIKSDMNIDVTNDIQYVLNTKDSDLSELRTISLNFVKEGVKAEFLAIYTASDIYKGIGTVSNHLVEHTSCDVKVKGVLFDKGKSDYIGKIIIDKKAQNTSSFLEQAVLVVGEGTHNESQPILEIEANEVSASHGATTGRINEDHLYYLQSRGLSKAEASKLVVEGFCAELIDSIIDADVKAQVLESLEF
jgi:Fe-S cluster assembly scaffold protein SufB